MSWASNNAKIGNAFASMMRNKEFILQQKLCNILDDAVTEALHIHEIDPTHHHHLEMGDDYGWILVHDGQIVQEKYYTTARNNGMLRGKLAQLASVQPTGYVGVVAAGMQHNRRNYYSLRFEMDVLQKTINYTIMNAPSQF